jgi:hypothetical protein
MTALNLTIRVHTIQTIQVVACEKFNKLELHMFVYEASVFLFVAVTASHPLIQDPERASRRDLLALIEAHRASFGDIEVSFKGRHWLSASATDSLTTCDGLWRYRSDGRQWAEFTESYGGKDLGKQVISTSDESETHSQGSRANIDRNRLYELGGGGRPGMLFALLTLADFWWPHLERSGEIEGTETIDGHKCLRFVFDARSLPYDGSDPVGPPRTARVWVDLERGGQVLRWEYSQPERGKTPTSLAEYHLVKFGAYWVPESSKKEIFLGPGGLKTKPVAIEEVAIDLSTLKINSGLRDSQVEAAIPPGTFVSDNLKGTKFYQGGSPPKKPLNDARSQLDALASDAESQQRAFRASYDRVSGTWVFCVVLLTASVIIGSVAILLRRFGH